MSLNWVIEYLFQIIITGIVGYLFTIVKITSRQYKSTQAGVKALLRDRLISSAHKATTRGYIYIHELENIDKMYKEYINLGGNGALVHLMKEIEKLPTKTSLK